MHLIYPESTPSSAIASASATAPPSESSADTKTSSNQCHIQLLSDWSVDEVCKWLEDIELQQYCDVFRENHIDGKELQALDSKNLTSDLGISKCFTAPTTRYGHKVYSR